MDWSALATSLGPAALAVIGSIAGGYFIMRPAMEGRRVEAAKIRADERKSDGDSASNERQQIREDMRLLLTEMRSEQARMQERDQRNQAKIDALTDKGNKMLETMTEMKGYIVQLRDFISRLGHEPPKPPRDWSETRGSSEG